MKALAYICSYKEDEQEFLNEIKQQKEKIENFAKNNNIEILDYYYEKHFARDDYKPVLFEIIANFYGKTDKLIAYNSDTISQNGNFKNWVKDELSRINIELLTVSQNESQAFVKAYNLKNKIKSIPSLPQVVEKVVQTVYTRNTDVEKLNNIISKDAGFTVKILKLANSPSYGCLGEIASTEKAFEILGLTTIRGLILSSDIFKAFTKNYTDKNDFNYERLWKHNLLTAIGADFLYKMLFDTKSDSIYTAGLLHDIGKIMLAKYDSTNYKKVYPLTTKSLNTENNFKIEKKYCSVTHTEIAHLVASEWKFPKEILDVILYHHSPENSEKFKLSCIIVNVADTISNMILMPQPMNIKLFNKEQLAESKINEEILCLLYNKLTLESQKMVDIEDIF